MLGIKDGIQLRGPSATFERQLNAQAPDKTDIMPQPDTVVQVGFPIMIKATAGGGGRGMRLAMKEEEFLTLMRQASQEAEAAFGNGAVYLERYVQNPRHIEFQVLRRGHSRAHDVCRWQHTQWLGPGRLAVTGHVRGGVCLLGVPLHVILGGTGCCKVHRAGAGRQARQRGAPL